MPDARSVATDGASILVPSEPIASGSGNTVIITLAYAIALPYARDCRYPNRNIAAAQ
jgi:hypothetical protein